MKYRVSLPPKRGTVGRLFVPHGPRARATERENQMVQMLRQVSLGRHKAGLLRQLERLGFLAKDDPGARRKAREWLPITLFPLDKLRRSTATGWVTINPGGGSGRPTLTRR